MMNCVRYDYSMYYEGCFVFPTIFLIIAIIILSCASLQFVKSAISHQVNTKTIATSLISILICGFLIVLNGSRIIHGGIYLTNEKERDAITCDGRITQINKLDIFEFPELETETDSSLDNITNGVQFIVDEMACVAITKGPFEVGDAVTVTYLPKSRYVLAISDK